MPKQSGRVIPCAEATEKGTRGCLTEGQGNSALLGEAHGSRICGCSTVHSSCPGCTMSATEGKLPRTEDCLAPPDWLSDTSSQNVLATGGADNGGLQTATHSCQPSMKKGRRVPRAQYQRDARGRPWAGRRRRSLCRTEVCAGRTSVNHRKCNLKMIMRRISPGNTSAPQEHIQAQER